VTGAEALRRAVPLLEEAGIENPARDARWLLAWAMGIDRAQLAGRLSDPLTEDLHRRFTDAIQTRCRRVPVSHITGFRAFYGRDFLVTPDVLDPRPETEMLVELALQAPFRRALDLGTGSGAIIVSLLAECPTASGVATDISGSALVVADRNARRHGVDERLDLMAADWVEGVEGAFDLVVSNPPYIAEAELADLSPDVRDHEPRDALTDGGDGLGAYRAIARGLRGCLAPGGRVMFEIGPTQAAAVTQILTAVGLRDLSRHRDLAGRPRVIAGVAPADFLAKA